MDQPVSSTQPSAHPADEIREQRNIAIILRTHLLNQGLDMPGCETAYMADFWVSKDCQTAWEAARRHQLMLLGDALDIVPTGRDARSDRSGMTSLELQRRRDARQELIDRVRGLVNPFAVDSLLPADQILRGNADLERAA
ncbi:hypothetical protein [Stenotrophomonas rhizophila]|nr:hypothetical protein [Stenotrophomonas rhizophila]